MSLSNYKFEVTDTGQARATIRKATAADAKAIRALIWKVGINPISLDWRRFL